MKRKDLPEWVGLFFVCPSSLSPKSSLTKSENVLGAVIERALRAAQRDGGWNCKGARGATIAIPG